MKKLLLSSAIIMLLGLSFTKCTPEENGDTPVHNRQIIHNAVIDVDGNQYDAVVLGEQVWMKSNLRVKHFRDGSPIPNGETDTFSLELPCYFQANVALEVSRGLYYNWSAVTDERGLCPDGWHVPTEKDWTEMEQYVGSQQQYVYGYESVNIAKALASQEGWKAYPEVGIPGHHPEANDATEFTAVPADCYYSVHSAGSDGYLAMFWTVSENNPNEACYHYISHESPRVYKGVYEDKMFSYNVRCIQD